MRFPVSSRRWLTHPIASRVRGRLPASRASLREPIVARKLGSGLDCGQEGSTSRTAVLVRARASGATAAPPKPRARQRGFESVFKDLHARRLLVRPGEDSVARAAARALAIPTVELVARPANGAGLFTLHGVPTARPAARGFAE